MVENKKTIYLSGPIMDEVSGNARQWRESAKLMMAGRFRLLDPMRRKFVDRQVDSANEIVEFDLQDVRDADILLVNYNKPSIGTSMEVFYAAHDLGKFVVAFSPFIASLRSPGRMPIITSMPLPIFSASNLSIVTFESVISWLFANLSLPSGVNLPLKKLI